MLPVYLAHYTQTDKYAEWVYSTQRVGAQPNINAQEYAALPLRLPAIQEQRAIVQVLESATYATAALDDKLAALQAQKRGLMQRLLTGEVRVSV